MESTTIQIKPRVLYIVYLCISMESRLVVKRTRYFFIPNPNLTQTESTILPRYYGCDICIILFYFIFFFSRRNDNTFVLKQSFRTAIKPREARGNRSIGRETAKNATGRVVILPFIFFIYFPSFSLLSSFFLSLSLSHSNGPSPFNETPVCRLFRCRFVIIPGEIGDGQVHAR